MLWTPFLTILLSLALLYNEPLKADSSVLAPVPAKGSPMALQRGAVVEGNGGEHITNEENPWFLNGAPVRYCINRDAVGFSVPIEHARGSIQDAIKTWVDMLAPAKAYGGIFGPILLPKSGIDWLALDFKEVACSGAHELEFLLGAREQTLDEAMKYTALNTIAISVRDEYSDDTGSGKGRIWFAADQGDKIYSGPNPGPGFWSVKKNFFNAAMHELGHVFGIRHTPKGFMSADYPSNLILSGMSSAASKDSLNYDYKFCGKIILSEKDQKNKKSPDIIARVYGIDIKKDFSHVCLTNPVSKPSHFPYQKTEEYLELSFYKEDLSSTSFEAKLTDRKDAEIPVLGQYPGDLNGQTLYLRWYFTTFMGPFSGRGLQNVRDKDYFMLIDTPFPGIVTIDLGIDGEWGSFSIRKDSEEVEEMYDLDQFNQVHITETPFQNQAR